MDTARLPIRLCRKDCSISCIQNLVMLRTLRCAMVLILFASLPIQFAAKENIKALIDEFMKVKPDPIFLHISHDTGKVLNEMGFVVNELGVETVIEIQTFNLVGNKKQQLRNARNGAKKDNVTVVEINTVDDAMLKSFKKISDGWMKEKVISEATRCNLLCVLLSLSTKLT